MTENYLGPLVCLGFMFAFGCGVGFFFGWLARGEKV